MTLPIPLTRHKLAGGSSGEVVTRTTNGCEVRVDIDQLVAIEQNKTQNIKGGSVISEGSCVDTVTKYALKKDYRLCEVSVDLDNGQATEKYSYYYTISDRKITVDGCHKDDRSVYAITEKNQHFLGKCGCEQSQGLSACYPCLQR